MYGGITQLAYIVFGSSQINHTCIYADTTTISVLGKFPVFPIGTQTLIYLQTVIKNINMLTCKHINAYVPSHSCLGSLYISIIILRCKQIYACTLAYECLGVLRQTYYVWEFITMTQTFNVCSTFLIYTYMFPSEYVWVRC